MPATSPDRQLFVSAFVAGIALAAISVAAHFASTYFGIVPKVPSIDREITWGSLFLSIVAAPVVETAIQVGFLAFVLHRRPSFFAAANALFAIGMAGIHAYASHWVVMLVALHFYVLGWLFKSGWLRSGWPAGYFAAVIAHSAHNAILRLLEVLGT